MDARNWVQMVPEGWQMYDDKGEGMSDWKVFQVDDDDFWVARSKEEAIKSYEYEITDIKEPDDVRQLTEEEMTTLKVQIADDDSFDAVVHSRTFSEYLAELNPIDPQLFASKNF